MRAPVPHGRWSVPGAAPHPQLAVRKPVHERRHARGGAAARAKKRGGDEDPDVGSKSDYLGRFKSGEFDEIKGLMFDPNEPPLLEGGIPPPPGQVGSLLGPEGLFGGPLHSMPGAAALGPGDMAPPPPGGPAGGAGGYRRGGTSDLLASASWLTTPADLTLPGAEGSRLLGVDVARRRYELEVAADHCITALQEMVRDGGNRYAISNLLADQMVMLEHPEEAEEMQAEARAALRAIAVAVGDVDVGGWEGGAAVEGLPGGELDVASLFEDEGVEFAAAAEGQEAVDAGASRARAVADRDAAEDESDKEDAASEAAAAGAVAEEEEEGQQDMDAEWGGVSPWGAGGELDEEQEGAIWDKAAVAWMAQAEPWQWNRKALWGAESLACNEWSGLEYSAAEVERRAQRAEVVRATNRQLYRQDVVGVPPGADDATADELERQYKGEAYGRLPSWARGIMNLRRDWDTSTHLAVEYMKVGAVAAAEAREFAYLADQAFKRRALHDVAALQRAAAETGRPGPQWATPEDAAAFAAMTELATDELPERHPEQYHWLSSDEYLKGILPGADETFMLETDIDEARRKARESAAQAALSLLDGEL